MDDPFITDPGEARPQRESHRFSTADTQFLSLNASSPAQIKRALEAHLAETERRLEEASKLGTSLVNQQKELTDKLQELEQQADENEVGPELRQRLADLEKEFNEIGRETARASLGPRSRHLASEDFGQNTPSLDSRVSSWRKGLARDISADC
jgi:predicted transcriptional regulator